MFYDFIQKLLDFWEWLFPPKCHRCNETHIKPIDEEKTMWAISRFFGYQLWIILIALYYFPYPTTILVVIFIPYLYKALK